MDLSTPDDADALAIRALFGNTRWASLATCNADSSPNLSQIAYAVDDATPALILHLSMLAQHTRNLLERPSCAVLVTQPDDGRDDPQTLVRMSVEGDAAVVGPSASEFERLRSLYLERLPSAEPRFDFGDFRLIRITLRAAHYVGGFARAHRVGSAQLLALLAH